MPSSYAVGAHFEQFIKDEVSGGRYASASEVVRDASLAALRFEVQQGLSSGPGSSAEEVFKMLKPKSASQASDAI